MKIIEAANTCDAEGKIEEIHETGNTYEVATVSRIDKIIGLLCRIWSVLQGSFAKETNTLIEPTNGSRPI